MRSFAFVAVALTCLLVTPAAAQTGSESNLVLTILGGAVTGHDLWTIDKQPVCVIPSGGGSRYPEYHTIRLAPGLRARLPLRGSAAHLPSPPPGVGAQACYP